MPDLHPMIVHFPIALVAAGVLLDLAGVFAFGARVRTAAVLLIAAGAVGALAAMLSGGAAEGAAENIVGIERALETHEELGQIAAWSVAALALLRLVAEYLWRRATLVHMLRAAGVLVLALVLYTGHTGGGLVRDYAAGTSKATMVKMITHGEEEE